MIAVEGLTRRFGGFTALSGVSLSIPRGKLVALLGPSGSGKTTLLRLLAGLDHPDAGVIRLEGIDATRLPPRDRKVGFVFQHYALFRHMTVAENIAFGLKVRRRAERPSRAAIAARVEALLALVQLEGLGERYPAQLSGGQRQRVALARALAIEPRLLLLDEPFGALDAQVRKDLRRWLRTLHAEVGLTGVFVTHDQEEALEVADEVVVMNAGRIEQVGTPTEIYDHPASAFVYRFLGNVNALPCVATAGRARVGTQVLSGVAGEGRGTLFIRPHDLILGPVGEGGCRARVRRMSVLGPAAQVDLDLGGVEAEATLSRAEADALRLLPGAEVGVRARRAAFFPVSS